VLDLMHRVTLIPMVRRTLFGPRITVFTKDGRSYTREGTGREFIWDFEEEARRIRGVAPGIPIGSPQFEELIEACRTYPGLSNARRITFEYVMLKDVNDSLEDAKGLIKLLKGVPAKINLIPFNPWPGTNYQCSDWEQIEKFADFINSAGYASPIRTPRGRDILAACGQLKSESERMRKTERLAFEAMMIANHGADD